MTEQQAARLGELVRKAREAKGLSLRTLEAETGVARTWLVYLEAGRSLEPSSDRLARVAEALGLDPARIDRVSGSYLARSLPTVRTYFRSKGKATPAELDELEQVIADVQAKYRTPERRGGSPAAASRSAGGGS
jgi:transcriptional regulator with XRE-family HTH domain